MTRILPLALLGVCLLPLPALAQAPACGRLIQLAAIDLVPVPNDARFLVPATVNGTPQKLLLSTAGGLITINQSAAKALGLGVHDTDQRVLDGNGFASRHYVEPKDFSVANAHVAGHSFALTPDPSAGSDPANDGVFDAGLRYRFDVEMDFAKGKLNYFSPNHCPGHVVYWPAQVAGEVPLSIVARTDVRARHGTIGGDAALMSSLDTLAQSDYFMAMIDSAPGITGTDIRITVTLDGENFTANIDTALEYSTVNSDAARARFAVTEASPGSAPLTALVADDPNHKAAPAGETVTVYGTHAFAHTFHTLAFGGVTVMGPKLMVRPDRTGTYDHDNDVMTGSRLYHMDDNVLPDISIGMDILSKLHLYFAFPEKKLYVTPASPTAG